MSEVLEAVKEELMELKNTVNAMGKTVNILSLQDVGKG